ncbi:MAG: PQQ-like beta-propeller repeat protein, partial [Candidatus Eremiobacteraeota bacterium]|nr:PQQ-like beta-propeller repeat protein [Candidatus Eremiobacteraeota bacterium]
MAGLFIVILLTWIWMFIAHAAATPGGILCGAAARNKFLGELYVSFAMIIVCGLLAIVSGIRIVRTGRTSWTFGIALIALFIAACFVAVNGTAACAAPVASTEPTTAMFRGNAAHLGVYDSMAPTLHSIRWRFRAKGNLISSPAVADGMVFVGSSDGNIYAVRTSNGARVWKSQTKGPVSSSPAVWNATVYAASVDGAVYAVNALNGKLKWRFDTAGERRFTALGIHGIIPKNEMMPDPFDMFISSPVIDNGTLYIGSGDHNVYALDATTGALRWKFTTGDVVHASPAVSGGVVYVGSFDRYFYALDAATGALRWKFLTGDDQAIHNQIGIVSSAAVADG